MFKHWQHIEVHAKENLPIANTFKNGEKQLVPIIFSHGLTSNRCMHSVMGIELASFGHIVFIIDHLDGTGSYSIDQKGNVHKFNTNIPRKAFLPNEAGHKFIEQAVEFRRQEVVALIDQVLEPEFCRNYLNFSKEVTINKDKLVLAGHSFGSSTMILTALNEPRAKVVCVMDSWLFPIATHIDQGKFEGFTTPIIFNIT
jgi:platelet-activating factor acetylhydrolase